MWRRHLGLWEIVTVIFHCFLTLYRQSNADYVALKNYLWLMGKCSFLTWLRCFVLFFYSKWIKLFAKASSGSSQKISGGCGHRAGETTTLIQIHWRFAQAGAIIKSHANHWKVYKEKSWGVEWIKLLFTRHSHVPVCISNSFFLHTIFIGNVKLKKGHQQLQNVASWVVCSVTTAVIVQGTSPSPSSQEAGDRTVKRRFMVKRCRT